MTINWKVRLRNKVWLAAMIALIVSFVYDLLAMLEVVPPVAEDKVMSIAELVLALLTGVGVLIDPTTKGASDSDRAMLYVEPGKIPDEE
jgi:phi LC3 family holin